MNIIFMAVPFFLFILIGLELILEKGEAD